MPDIHSMQDKHNLFFVSVFSHVPLTELFVGANGLPSCLSTSPMNLLEASHSKTKVLVKCDRVSTMVVHRELFKSWKSWLVASFQLK
jgi:hypothetical protein